MKIIQLSFFKYFGNVPPQAGPAADVNSSAALRQGVPQPGPHSHLRLQDRQGDDQLYQPAVGDRGETGIYYYWRRLQ